MLRLDRVEEYAILDRRPTAYRAVPPDRIVPFQVRVRPDHRPRAHVGAALDVAVENLRAGFHYHFSIDGRIGYVAALGLHLRKEIFVRFEEVPWVRDIPPIPFGLHSPRADEEIDELVLPPFGFPHGLQVAEDRWFHAVDGEVRKVAL